MQLWTVCFIIAMVLTMSPVAVLGALQNYTCTIGDTARLFSPRSDREHLKDFMKYRVWKENTPFAVIENGAPAAKCLNDDLELFCVTKVQFQVWNKSDLLLEINNTNYEDSGEYDVEHVFGGLEGNHKDIIYLEINASPAVTYTDMPRNSTSTTPPPSMPAVHDADHKNNLAMATGIISCGIAVVLLLGVACTCYHRRGRIFGHCKDKHTVPVSLMNNNGETTESIF